MFCKDCNQDLTLVVNAIGKINYCPLCGGSLIEIEQNSDIKNLLTFIEERYNFKFVKCCAGEFQMRSPNSEYGRFQDEALHEAIINKDFYIGIYPVTQALYEAVVGENPSEGEKCEDYPVVNVSWLAAQEFCKVLNEKTSFIRPADYVFDLPTEAQWEYACRAGTTTDLNNNELLDSNNYHQKLDSIGWYEGNSKHVLHSVGKKNPNAWGLYDMHGLVWEWCKDSSRKTLNIPFIPLFIKNIFFAQSSDFKVCRGGSISSDFTKYLSANRNLYKPDFVAGDLGFRVALVAVEK